MKDILQEIIAHKQIEIECQREAVPTDLLAGKIARCEVIRSFSQSLRQSPSGIIAEFKRRSPSKGWINRQARPEEIATGYQQAGAAALSILTDESYFGGTLGDIIAVRPSIHIPILRKEFVIDEYQLYQAKAADADAILLIAAALSREQCLRLSALASQLGLEILLEIHEERELDYINEHVQAIGVNNRNLGTFVTDVENSFRLAEKLPRDRALVSESGLSSPQTVFRLRQAGFQGFLIGENFMKTDCPSGTLEEFIQAIGKQ